MRKPNESHGASRTPLYKVWTGMIQRCHNPNSNGYELYGGRGISVCDRWKNSFAAFAEDVGERPPDASLDRFPNQDGNYEPTNIRWASPTQQQRNTRWNVKLEYGKTMLLQEWAELLDINYEVLRSRYKRKWTPERILTEPIESRQNTRNVTIEFNGQSMTLAEWAKYLGVNYYTLESRISRGWTIEKSLTIHRDTPVSP
jgi:hypothetical protein